MRNKIKAKQTGLLLFAMLCMLCATTLCVAGEETFITEEQATIGGESDTKKAEEASQPFEQVPQLPEQVPQPPEQIPQPPRVPSSSGVSGQRNSQEITPQESTNVSREESDTASGSEDAVLKTSVSDNSVSVNSVRDSSETSHKKSANIQFRKKFSVPSQKKFQEQSQEQFHRQSEVMQEKTIQPETKNVCVEYDLSVRICLVIGILCLLAGIARIVWRIVIPCRKLYRHML